MVETTDDHLRYEFLRLLAEEGRQHYMRQIAEENISETSRPMPLRLVASPMKSEQ